MDSVSAVAEDTSAPVKMARLKWKLADPQADPFASEGPFVDGRRPSAPVASQPSGGSSANSRLVGYSPWKTLDQVMQDVAKLDALPAASRWYTYEIQMKDTEGDAAPSEAAEGDAAPASS